MRIREMSPEDHLHLIVLGAEFWAQTGLPGDYCVTSVSRLLENLQEHGFLLLLEKESVVGGEPDLPRGFIAMSVRPASFTDTMQATEIAFYVQPGFRRHGIRLLREAERRARLAGCASIVMISLSGMERDGKDRAGALYEKMGYSRQETAFSKELTDGAT